MSSKENQIVIQHQKDLLEIFASVTDERIGMKHSRYVIDDYFSADESIKPCCAAVPASADGIYALWLLAEGADPKKRILYLHGGGYVVGSLRGYQCLGSHLSAATGACVLLIDYRLAPEDKFPAGIEDVKTAFNWMLKNGPDGASPAAKSYIGGDSAGGGLSLASTLAMRDEGLILPDGVVALSPWTELEPTSASFEDNSETDPFLSKEGITGMADAYVNTEDEKRNPLASPLFASFRDFPDLLIQVGSREMLLDDSKRVAEKAKEEGCQVDLQVWEDMVHVWQGYAPFLPEAVEALDAIGRFVNRDQ
ncbi:MAG: alpha/beta hydrolase [Candidatus Hydrogenedentota bacterium]